MRKNKVNTSKNTYFWKKIIPHNTDQKTIIHKFTKFQANIFKKKRTNIFVNNDDDNYN